MLKTPEIADRVLEAKVQGTLALWDLLGVLHRDGLRELGRERVLAGANDLHGQALGLDLLCDLT